MKRTPLTRKVPLRSTQITPGTQPPRREVKPEPRRRRVAGTRGNPIPTRVREQVRERSGGQCELRAADDCTFLAVEQHHRQRRREGGHPLSSVVDSCSPCHRYTHAHPQQARERGWIVSAFAVDAALEPIRYGDPAERLTWFRDDGTKDTAYITPERN